MSKDVADNDKSPLMAALTEFSGSLIAMARERISEKVDRAIETAIRAAVVTLVIVLCTLFGLGFLAVGFALWLGAASGIGTWFGLVITGCILLFTTTVIALVNRR